MIHKIRAQYATDAKLIVTACRLTPWKGVDGIIRALPRLIEVLGKLNFLVLGDGPQLEKLKSLAQELSVADRVFFLGRFDQEIVNNYTKAADVYILNTNYEGLSHALLEVMRMGTPIIASKSGGNPEVIDDKVNGLLIRYNNIDDIVDAAQKILSDPAQAREYVGRGYEKLKIFSWDKNIAATVKLINDIVYG